MKLLVVGSGGREHALAWKLSQSPKIKEVIIAPGNDGIALEPNIRREKLAMGGDYQAVLDFVQSEGVGFVVIGPENVLADGLVDKLTKIEVPAFGPTEAAAQLESSKSFSKEIMREANVPTAEFSVFTNVDEAKAFVDKCGFTDGVVVKADGLAAGKGVVVAESKEQAKAALDDFMVDGAMGEAGAKVVLEERLIGREVSAFYVCDGEDGVLVGFACDYKRIYDGGKGPNTGGMGAYTPADWLPEDYDAQVREAILTPILKTMKDRGTPFRGVLFIGLMQTEAGPKVIEFNVRFGDPETQALMVHLDSDLFPVFQAATNGSLATLGPQAIRRKSGATIHVVMAAKGYPGTQGEAVRKGDSIQIAEEFLPATEKVAGQKLFFAGVKERAEEKGVLETSGGRVLGLTVTGKDLETARSTAYTKIRGIRFADSQMRTDIGL